MNTILVPLDGSTLAEQVLPTVRQLAVVLDARVRLLRVIDMLDVARTPTVDPAQAQVTQHILQEQAAAYLAAQVSAFRGTSIIVDYEVRVGSPAETIVAVATYETAMLIALATHGYSGLRRWALGSVSDKVAQIATMPVLLVRGAERSPLSERPINRILVPLDGSETAQQALPLALNLAQHADAQVVMVTAVNPSVSSFAWSQQTYDETLHRLQATTTEMLDKLAASLRRESVSIRTVVEVGYPPEVILHAATFHQTDLIVMASHGMSGARRWALGSVADKVLHATTTPLLLVHAVPGKGSDCSSVLAQSTVAHPTYSGDTSTAL